MCIIFSADKGNMIPLEALQDGTRKNSDGWGIMTHTGEELLTFKDYKPDAQAVYDITKKLTTPTVVHLRMTTHGRNSLDNTHPFDIIPGRLVMMHNGVVDVPVPRRSNKSDTRVLVDDYLKPLIGNKPGRLKNKGLKNFIQNLIGSSSNRLVFMDEEGKLTYFNKNLGLEWRGIWASNTYGWTLHSEDKQLKRITNYGSYKDWVGGFDDMRYASHWNKDTSTRHIPSKTLADEEDDFTWADKMTQAQSDNLIDDYRGDEQVETEFGYMVPMWLGDLLNLEFEDMLNEPVESLAAALETLRDTYIGVTK